MKNKRLMDAFSLVDEKFIEEAAPDGGRRRQIRTASLHRIACACLAFAVALAVFIPLTLRDGRTPELPSEETKGPSEGADGADGSDQPAKKDPYKEIFDKLSAAFDKNNPSSEGVQRPNGFTGVAGDKGDIGAAGTDGADGGNVAMGGSQQIVDNQTEGVDEADIIKRTGSHIFYFSATLDVYTIDGENSKLIAQIPYRKSLDKYSNCKLAHKELLLAEDGKTLILIVELTSNANVKDKKTAVITYDVSDPENITHIKTQSISGAYSEARLTNGSLLVFTEYDVCQKPQKDDLSTYIPYYETDGKIGYIDHQNIFVPEGEGSSVYTVVTQLDIKIKSYEILGMYALLHFKDSIIYVSENSVYVMRERFIKFDLSGTIILDKNPKTIITKETQIVRYWFDDFLNTRLLMFKGDVTVSGVLANRYCIDEHNGVLRVVTSAPVKTVAGYVNGNTVYTVQNSADLYCFDINTLQRIATVKAFAPNGEQVISARFDGNRAYVCTAAKISQTIINDPVFFFDLSDLKNITYTDTGTIPGFSTSLIQFGNGKLIGIGRGETNLLLKLEAYAEEDGKVVPISKYTPPMLFYTLNYKAYFIDRENGYIGISGLTPKGNRYLLVKFDGENFIEAASVELDSHFSISRGFVADGYLYVVTPNDLKVVKLS